ncbi:response regulator receiver protein [[Leptolyngbya] sp. PCC 7376]|uniref:response regulator n=1 Tax=[Leptolyngbya] sp. PCC 7376 TaxID=111781 RepID=UPI00029F3522|nr:response regulator [[Leptolyngbya] sp. PCC 7376]AFY38879.1 response regulator receiver protein [[Leptolyngbya] sp. PCC 7376]
MHGTLNEIDIRSIFQLVELGQRTGQLVIDAPTASFDRNTSWQNTELFAQNRDIAASSGRNLAWYVFFVNGQITYATNNRSSNLKRLKGYLRHYHLDEQLDELKAPEAIASMNIIEYAYLWLLLEQHVITTDQGRHILQRMIQETLFDLLSLHQGSFNFRLSTPLSPQLASYSITNLLLESAKKVQKWKQLLPLIKSPHQCPIIIYENKVAADLPPSAYQRLTHWSKGKTSLRQLARYLNRDLVTLSKALHPYVEKDWIQMLNPDQPAATTFQPAWEKQQTLTAPKILCIDDDLTIGKTVEEMLRPYGYEVELIQNPLVAFERAFSYEPDLILCDIAMPKLDGNQICNMLRASNRFRLTPIVMLTGKEGFIDRIKANMVGSSDYLTKPFGSQELLALIEKYISWQMPMTSSAAP